jgi:hypothetical protein
VARSSGALHLDLGGSCSDLMQIVWRKSNGRTAETLVKPMNFRVPGMGTIHGFCASNHASAIWANGAKRISAETGRT